jgi:bifunctional non-homologous end joining protein LigD
VPMPPRPRSRPLADFIEPCLPRLADKPPAGPDWLHEIKHDGFRIMARRDGDRVRLLSRKGHDFASRFPLAAAAVAALSARSCIIDGEAIACDEKGLAVFDLIRRQQHGRAVALCAFDLIELDGEDLRRQPIETRKSLKSLLRGKHAGIAFNAHFIGDGAIVYRQACALGCEGIVSKRLGSPYRSGRADCWLKVKNPHAPAVRRIEEEDWNS